MKESEFKFHLTMQGIAIKHILNNTFREILFDRISEAPKTVLKVRKTFLLANTAS